MMQTGACKPSEVPSGVFPEGNGGGAPAGVEGGMGTCHELPGCLNPAADMVEVPEEALELLLSEGRGGWAELAVLNQGLQLVGRDADGHLLAAELDAEPDKVQSQRAAFQRVRSSLSIVARVKVLNARHTSRELHSQPT